VRQPIEKTQSHTHARDIMLAMNVVTCAIKHWNYENTSIAQLKLHCLHICRT